LNKEIIGINHQTDINTLERIFVNLRLSDEFHKRKKDGNGSAGTLARNSHLDRLDVYQDGVKQGNISTYFAVKDLRKDLIWSVFYKLLKSEKHVLVWEKNGVLYTDPMIGKIYKEKF